MFTHGKLSHPHKIVLLLLRWQRHRRQLAEMELSDQTLFQGRQTMLNQSVPFIFSARLYPYGSKNGDTTLVGASSEFKLSSSELIFLDQTFDTIWIHRNGIVSLAPDFDPPPMPKSLPILAGPPLIAAFWAKEWNAQRRRVLIRETNDETILALAQSEVNIQFRYGKEFEPNSMVIITWMNSEEDEENELSEADELFQLALILGNNACFAHFIFSKLPKAVKAMSGFNGPTVATSSAETATEMPMSLMLPGSGTSETIQLTEKSNIGIPGEWLMRIDEEQIYLCGAGFQGIECVDSCLPNQWHLDCSRQCHCAEGSACNIETGECPDGKCNPGWKGAPICDEDIDECQDESISCPDEQPDCMNTPGAYLCFCFEYDNSTGICIGSSGEAESSSASQRIPVPVASVVLTPQLGPSLDKFSNSRQNTTTSITRPSAPKLLLLGTETPATIQSKSGLPHKTASAIAPPLLHSASAGSSSREHSATACSSSSSCNANARCVQDVCQCSNGWNGDGKSCTDVDECSLNSTICGSYAECQNTVGSYQCVCNVGFIARSDGQGCIDVNECEEAVPGNEQITVCPQENTVCTNFVGGFDCQCKSGFSGDPLTGGCKDINECEMADHYCGSNANCTNLVGTFRCECLDGFERVPNTSNGECKDIDECILHAACHRAATCTNVEGSYRCGCVDGFIGNGTECHETILFPIGQKRTTGDKKINFTIVQLADPIKIFGQNYTQIYISPNGYISFNLNFNDTINDEIFEKIQRNQSSKNVFNNGAVIFMPLFAKFVSKYNGFIDIQQIDEQSPISKGPLSRAALQIQQHFRIDDFKPQRLFIATWGEMNTVLQSANTGGSTFQLILVDGTSPTGTETFAIFLYESIEEISGGKHFFTGILHPLEGILSLIPLDQLVTGTNVGQPGKWIFRVDQTKLYTCPSGTKGAPLCQEDCAPGTFGLNCEGKCRCANGLPCDFASGNCSGGKCAAGFLGRSCDSDVDECDLGTHRCHKNANCSNLIGSYSCTCNEPFHGNGFNCSIADTCLLRFKSKCAQNAHCDSTNEELPECMCNDGFYGDGRRKCEPNEMSSTMDKSATITSPTSASTRSTTTTATLRTTTVLSTTVSLTVFTTSRKAFVPIKNETTTTTIKVPIAGSNNELLSEANESKALVLVVCSAIGAVWLIVAIFFSLIYCIKRYRRIRASEYSPEMLTWNATRTVTRNGRSMYNLSSTKFI
uniref:Uncharacterized protein n=1 Tax=Globodera rostochiensis TaxID=31243 RepID=A0A914IFU5_GLORO